LSLTELVRHRRIDELKSLAGHVDLGIDLGRSRRRPSLSRAGTGNKEPRTPARGRANPRAKS